MRQVTMVELKIKLDHWSLIYDVLSNKGFSKCKLLQAQKFNAIKSCHFYYAVFIDLHKRFVQ